MNDHQRNDKTPVRAGTNIPMPAPLQPSKRQAVDAFSSLVSGLYEKDYGDFMRKVVLYMERLRVDLSGSSGGSAEEPAKILANMKHYLVFAPDFDIESTRLKLLRDADQLRRMA